MKAVTVTPATVTRWQHLGAGCTLFFAVPFLAVGVGAFFLDVKAGTTPIERFGPKLFGVVFLGAGLTIVGLAIGMLRDASRTATLAAVAPGQPWRWREDWAANRSDDLLRKGIAASWWFAVLWSLLSSFTLFIVPDAVAAGKFAALLALIFPLIGVGLLLHAAYGTWRAMKFGRSVLELASNPWAPGRGVSATLRARISEVPETGFDATLRQIHRITTGSGKQRSTREEVKWEQQTRVARGAIGPSADALRIPVHFTIPEDAHDTDSSDANSVHLWRVDVSASIAGVDYAARFEVPVFRAGM